MFNFELTLDEANVVLGSLGKQPYEAVANLIQKIREQAQPQLARVQAEVEAQQKAAAEAQEAK